MKKKILLLLLVAFMTAISLSAQDINSIKKNPNYYSAEGIGDTYEDAQKDASAKISRSISAIVVDEIKTRVTEKNNDYYSETKGGTKQFSFARLDNMKVIDMDPEDGQERVFAYISKTDVEQAFNERAQLIRDYIEAGQKCEKRLQIDDALKNYYWALQLSKVMNKSVTIKDKEGKDQNVATYLPSKLSSVIGNIKTEFISSRYEENRYYVQMRFAYAGNDVASVSFHYFDGEGRVGPTKAKDGMAELEMVTMPADKNISITYDYMFKEEAINMGGEMRAVMENVSTSKVTATVKVPVKISGSGASTNMASNASATNTSFNVKTSATEDASTKPEEISIKKQMEMKTVDNPAPYDAALSAVEEAIKKKNPELARKHFTEDGFNLFQSFFKNCGSISLLDKNASHEYVVGNGQVIGRFIRVKLKFRDKRSFMENLTFRFDNNKKIQSLAFALTKKAEEDIFNAAYKWTDVSRYTILQFMEDYQTAYAFKRIEYLEKVFSDHAIIIVGSMLQDAPEEMTKGMEGNTVNFSDRKDVKYVKLNKKEFLDRARKQFGSREYIHLTFEDNETESVKNPNIPKGSAFGIQIKQTYNSPIYSDEGYLTLMLNTSTPQPVILVRLWEPDKGDLVRLNSFIGKFNF